MEQEDSPQPPHRLLGKRVKDRYLIRREIGRGGMGVVFAARDEELERDVAIKVLAASYASDEGAVSRFFREAKTAGAIGHPNITAVYDLGRLRDTRPFMVMPLLEGRSIGDIICQDAPLTIKEVVRYLRGAAAAIDALHARGLVHRDIKPENIVVEASEDGQVMTRVLDFGLAALTSGENKLTRDGVISGTPDYMPPESAGGRNLDPRGDIYSLGVVAYEMLAGRVPFEADNPIDALVQKRMNSAPLLAERSGREFFADVEAVFIKVLAIDPAHRYATAGEFIEALEEMSVLRPATARVTADLAALDPSEGAQSLGDGRDTRPGATTQIDSQYPDVGPSRAPGPDTVDALLADMSSMPGSAGRRDPRRTSGVDAPAAQERLDNARQPSSANNRRSFRVWIAGLVLCGLIVLPLLLLKLGDEPRTSDAQAPPASRRAKTEAAQADEAAGPNNERTETKTESVDGSDATAVFVPQATVARAPESTSAKSVKTVRDARLSQTPSEGPRKATEETPDDIHDAALARGLVQQATKALVEGRFADAVRSFHRATQADTGSATAWRGLGLANEKLGRGPEARRAYTRYLRLRPSASDAPQIRARMRTL